MELAALTALADTEAQQQLLSRQLSALCLEIRDADPGSGHHLALSQRAVALRGQLAEVDKQVAALTELAKSAEERAAEAAENARAAALALAARIADDKERVLAIIADINAASDALADALTQAGQYVPPVVDDLRVHGDLKLGGNWETILPSTWGGEGKIARLPWVVFDEERRSATLSTRGRRLG